ncbi:hypothetical protein [Streptomyces decoyicus]
MPTRIFTTNELEDIGLPFECDAEDEPGYAVELHREQVDTRRWMSVHQLIFRAPDDGKVYSVLYEQGLTEMQDDHDHWGYEDRVKAIEMEPQEVTVTRWVAVQD